MRNTDKILVWKPRAKKNIAEVFAWMGGKYWKWIFKIYGERMWTVSVNGPKFRGYFDHLSDYSCIFLWNLVFHAKEEHMLGVFDNGLHMYMYDLKKEVTGCQMKLHKEELHKLYSLRN
jgi:hypothetical protein